jgi:hypothetical protein
MAGFKISWFWPSTKSYYGTVVLIGPQISENWPRTIRATVPQVKNTPDVLVFRLHAFNMLRKSERYLPLIYSQQHSNRNIIGEISHNLTAMRNCHITKQQKPTKKLHIQMSQMYLLTVCLFTKILTFHVLFKHGILWI